MCKIKVANRSNVLKDQDRILSSLEGRIKGIVVDILSGVEMNLAEELRGHNPGSVIINGAKVRCEVLASLRKRITEAIR